MSLISTFVILNLANALSVNTHPKVSDWREAKWFNGLIKIPLRNPKGHTWFASLQMGTPLQYEQVCVIDSNNAYTMTFSKNNNSLRTLSEACGQKNVLLIRSILFDFFK